ncbi:MAG: BMP family ABC transporter substrate-binding protein [Anaerolineaceae bacterium]|nr:BMP family ABC transporter substrate-binding protein [Anaerolineaceae bacterium]
MKQSRWIGQTLNGRYKIEELLGQGGMSAVYKAIDPNLRRVVAIKIVHPHLSSDPSFLRRFEEEAAAIASLRHPNIVQVFDFNTDEDVNYMVMEYVPGETLQARLQRLNKNQRKMAIEDAIQITTNVCDGLSYAHKRGMVHRDVKPGNIMLDINNQAVLMDFGIVKIVGSSAHTLTGTVIGTANYMAPEVIRSEPADQRSDIYSLGITLFEMLSGRPPFEADSAMTIMLMHLNDPIPDIMTIRDDLPEELTQIIKKTLEKDRNNRFQTADDLVKALRNLHHQMETNEIKWPTASVSAELKDNEEQLTHVIPPEQLHKEDVTMVDLSSKKIEQEVTRIDHSNVQREQDVTVVERSNEPLASELITATVIEKPAKLGASDKPKKKPKILFIGLILVTFVLVVIFIGMATSWFGFTGEKPIAELTQPTQKPANTDSLHSSQLTLSAMEVMNAARAESTKKTETAILLQEQEFNVCQLTDLGSVFESTFQQTVNKGIMNAEKTLGIKVEVLQSFEEGDYEKHLTTFVERRCDLIVSAGYMLGDITIAFAQANPEINFSVIDVDVDTDLPNLSCQIYQIDEAAFLAGYLAARMTETGFVATYGGMPLQPVKLFMDGFTRGVSYYNRVKGVNVQVIGWNINNPDGGMFVNSFDNMDLGVEIGNELINQNVDIIFPVAGQVGLGTAMVIKERDAGYIIGVDSDWVIENPEFAAVILTSVLKNTDVTTYEIIQRSVEGAFEGGKYVGRLENDGVGLAPFYEMEQIIPEQIRIEIQEIREKIIVGEIELSPIYKIK